MSKTKLHRKPEQLTGDEELAAIHARMRQRDLERMANGEATPEEIQAENSIFPKFEHVYLPKLTI